MATQCQGKNRSGEPCSAYVDPGQTWCKWHDPARAADRIEWSRRGGAARSNKARAKKQLAEQVMSIDDLDAMLCDALKRVAAGKLEPGVGTAMAGIAKTVVGIRKDGELERRFAELEERVGIVRRDWSA